MSEHEDGLGLPAEVGVGLHEMSKHERLLAKYGPMFPDLDLVDTLVDKGEYQEAGKLWRAWIDSQVQAQAEVMETKRLHWARHRLFRWGKQWISSRDGRTWREMGASGSRVRKEFNIIGPGLDFRLGLLEEQRPGWKHEPIPGMGVDGRETAEAQQSLVEWIFKTQKIWRLARLAYAQAQTDGVAFLQVYTDKNAGPVVERVRTISQDDERYPSLLATGHAQAEDGTITLPLGPSSEELDANASPSTFTSGELRTRLILAAETYCDLEAETVNGPNQAARWFLVRRPRDLQAARLETGRADLRADGGATYSQLYGDGLDGGSMHTLGLPPFPRKRMTDTDANVWDYTIYLSPDKDLDRGPRKRGRTIRLLGDHMLARDTPLPGGLIPLARITDGSPDSEMYPRPQVSDWVPDQVTINALGSKIIEYVRMHSGSRLLSLKDTVIEETWNNITGSIINYRGAKPDVLQAPRVAPDLWAMFQQLIASLQDQIGHSDLNRGKVSNVDSGFQDVSGRAVLGAREMSERQFGPMIRAAADGMTDWAELVVVGAQTLYKLPRLIPMVGRADLAKRIDSDTLSGQPSVYLDPETLMPMPRALRNQMLIDHLDRGLIDTQEYAKRAPYAEIRSLNFGDHDQWERAQWVNTVMEERLDELADMPAIALYQPDGLPVFWQDTPEVHMRALDEIILDERKPWPLRQMATDRWGIYAELARSKNFPAELEMQGMPRPPAPLEVLGVPNVVPQSGKPSKQARAGGSPGGRSPGASGQGTPIAPDMAPVARNSAASPDRGLAI